MKLGQVEGRAIHHYQHKQRIGPLAGQGGSVLKVTKKGGQRREDERCSGTNRDMGKFLGEMKT